MTWQLLAAANLIAAGAYLTISYIVARGLVSTGQLRTNRLGAATALILFSGGLHHAVLGGQLVAPELAGGYAAGLRLRDGFGWHNLVWDGVVAAFGLYYLSLRGTYASALRGAQMYEDVKLRERQALEINDTIVQGLTVAKYALTMGADDQSRKAIEDTLQRARAIITDLLGDPADGAELGPGDLRRSAPAAVAERDVEVPR